MEICQGLDGITPRQYTWRRIHLGNTSFLVPAVLIQAEPQTTACVQNVQTLERSEQDAINVLEMVPNEYPVDRSPMFRTGHSLGSGGTWYLAAKYAGY